jgi:hypothetical protein
MWLRLALALGATVAELQERMERREFLEWLAFYRVEPFGHGRDDLHAAMVLAMLANIHRKEGASPMTVETFVPDFWAETQTVSLLDKFRQLTEAHEQHSGDAGRQAGAGRG